jgi:hypothetical protein
MQWEIGYNGTGKRHRAAIGVTCCDNLPLLRRGAGSAALAIADGLP